MPGLTGEIAVLVIVVVCYFLPSLVAIVRNKTHGTAGVMFVNLVLGWTIIGWFAAFIWACSGTTEAERKREEQRHAETIKAIAASKTSSA